MALALLTCASAHAQQTQPVDSDAIYAQQMIHSGLNAPEMVLDSALNLKISNFLGRYVVLRFWSTSLPENSNDTPIMARLTRQYNNDSIVFIQIAYDKDEQTWNTYRKEHEMPGLSFLEKRPLDSAVSAKIYSVKHLPAMYVINTRGKVLLATTDVRKLQDRLTKLDLSQVRVPRNRMSRQAQFQGGLASLRTYLVRNIKYPNRAANYGIEGETVVSFTVEKDGSITNPQEVSNKITKSESLPFKKLSGDEQRNLLKECLDAFSEEALRVISAMPKWRPGLMYGNAMRFQYQLPVTFRIDTSKDNDTYPQLHFF